MFTQCTVSFPVLEFHPSSRIMSVYSPSSVRLCSSKRLLMPAVAEANAAQAKPQEAASSEDIRKDINGALHLSEQEKVIPGNSALSAFLLALFQTPNRPFEIGATDNGVSVRLRQIIAEVEAQCDSIVELVSADVLAVPTERFITSHQTNSTVGLMVKDGA